MSSMPPPRQAPWQAQRRLKGTGIRTIRHPSQTLLVDRPADPGTKQGTMVSPHIELLTQAVLSLSRMSAQTESAAKIARSSAKFPTIGLHVLGLDGQGRLDPMLCVTCKLWILLVTIFQLEKTYNKTQPISLIFCLIWECLIFCVTCPLAGS